jgi:hypothetical protein
MVTSAMPTSVEMWGSMREWLPGGALPSRRELLADLTGVEYGYTLKEDELVRG